MLFRSCNWPREGGKGEGIHPSPDLLPNYIHTQTHTPTHTRHTHVHYIHTHTHYPNTHTPKQTRSGTGSNLLFLLTYYLHKTADLSHCCTFHLLWGVLRLGEVGLWSPWETYFTFYCLSQCSGPLVILGLVGQSYYTF